MLLTAIGFFFSCSAKRGSCWSKSKREQNPIFQTGTVKNSLLPFGFRLHACLFLQENNSDLWKKKKKKKSLLADK